MARAFKAIRVVVCDDDPVVRTALASYLARDAGIELVDSFSNAPDVLAYLEHHSVDVILMDVQMPGMDGITAAAHISALHDAPKVLILTALQVAEPGEAHRAGAAGFLMKDATPTTITSAIHAVHNGLNVISTGRLPHAVPRPPLPEGFELSERQREILTILCQGATNAEICAQVHLSEPAVKREITLIMRSLGTTSRLQTVVRANQLGIATS